jgi:hypothetical protein
MTEIDTRNTMNASRIRTITSPGIAGIGHATASTSHTVRRMVATESSPFCSLYAARIHAKSQSLPNGLREAA